MKTVVSSVMLTLMFVCGTAVAGTDEQPVLDFADFSDTGGKSFLTRLYDKIVISVEAEGLNPGDATTLWWVVFNNPAGCAMAPVCGTDADFTGPGIAAAGVALGNASGNVVKSNGTVEYGGILRQGTNDDHQVFFGAGFEVPWLLNVHPDYAEVHIVIQSHGQARGGEKLLEQLTYLEANCTPSCGDVQFAVHPPPAP